MSNNIDKVHADEITEASVTTVSNGDTTSTTTSNTNTSSNNNSNTTTITTNKAPVSIVNYSNEITESSDTYDYSVKDNTTDGQAVQDNTVVETIQAPTENTTTNTDTPTTTDTSNQVQNNTSTNNQISTLEYVEITNKVFIGDSRTVHMKQSVDSSRDVWSCKSAMGLKWMKSTGVPAVEDKISTGTAVIILMGVNDLYNTDNYIAYINQKSNEWRQKGAKTFFVSVNPINEQTYKGFKNTKIETFNSKMQSSLTNVTYIDTYNYLITHDCKYTSDGLHYQASTSKAIYDMICNQVK